MKKQDNSKDDDDSESKTQQRPGSIPNRNKPQPSKLREGDKDSVASAGQQSVSSPADLKKSGKSNQINNTLEHARLKRGVSQGRQTTNRNNRLNPS